MTPTPHVPAAEQERATHSAATTDAVTAAPAATVTAPGPDLGSDDPGNDDPGNRPDTPDNPVSSGNPAEPDNHVERDEPAEPDEPDDSGDPGEPAVLDLLAHCDLVIPRAWLLVDHRRVRRGDRPALLLRYQPWSPLAFGGPRASAAVDLENGTLLGWARVDLGRTAEPPGPLHAQRAAAAFLRRVDPVGVGSLILHWLAQTDEPLVLSPVGTGRPPRRTVVSGMQVRFRQPDGCFTDVVIAGDLSVLCYERDIAWDTSQARRRTEMWLHDRWLAARDAADAGNSDSTQTTVTSVHNSTANDPTSHDRAAAPDTAPTGTARTQLPAPFPPV